MLHVGILGVHEHGGDSSLEHYQQNKHPTGLLWAVRTYSTLTVTLCYLPPCLCNSTLTLAY